MTNKTSNTTTANNKQHIQRRQAISGMIVTIILIGIVVSVGGILATTTTDLVSTGLVLETVEIKRLVIQNTQNSSFVSAMIKNNGNTDLQGAHIIIQKNDGMCTYHTLKGSATNGSCTDDEAKLYFGGDISKKDVITQSGESTIINSKLTERLPIGQKVIVTIQADVVGGGQYLITKSVSPQ